MLIEEATGNLLENPVRTQLISLLPDQQSQGVNDAQIVQWDAYNAGREQGPQNYCLDRVNKKSVPAYKREELTMMERTELAVLVETLDRTLAHMIRADMTDVEQVPTPFFVHGTIYRVKHLLPTHPVVFTVGCVGPRAVLLPTNPDAYMLVARAGGVQFQDDAARLAYVVTFLETTRSFSERFQILHNVEGIAPRYGLDAQQLQRFKAIRSRFRDQIVPPTITGSGPWEVTVFAIHGQELEKITLKLGSDGSIRSTPQRLEPDLPIADALRG